MMMMITYRSLQTDLYVDLSSTGPYKRICMWTDHLPILTNRSVRGLIIYRFLQTDLYVD